MRLIDADELRDAIMSSNLGEYTGLGEFCKLDALEIVNQSPTIDYVHSLESAIAQLKAENAYHIAKIKSMYKDIENASRGPVYNFDSNGYAVMMPAEHYAQMEQRIKELEAENTKLRDSCSGPQESL